MSKYTGPHCRKNQQVSLALKACTIWISQIFMTRSLWGRNIRATLSSRSSHYDLLVVSKVSN